MGFRISMRTIKPILLILTLVSITQISYLNCSAPYAIKSAESSTITNGQFLITENKASPPLDLFFIIDNSYSMQGNQLNLANSFSNIFTNNQGNLSNFNTRIFIYSTASTMNSSTMTSIPTRNPASVSSIPTDISSLALIPGSIFGTWNNQIGSYGSVPFSTQFYPASVLDFDNSVGGVTQSLSISAASSDPNYASSVAALTQKFQNRINYLNPVNQTNYQSTTNISSGLCTMSRILRHAPDQNLIRPGDAAAFILVSDDDDRLNAANPNNNQCIESVIGSENIQDGYCGHYETDYTYNTTASIIYQTQTNFSYESGSQINYSYNASENCNYSYQDGYSYTSTYVPITTNVTYTKCNLYADSFCSSQSTAVQSVSGNYVASGNSCTMDMTNLVTSPLAGTTFTCTAGINSVTQGPSGLDTASNGSTCSVGVLNSLQGANKTNIVCTIVGAHINTSGMAWNQPLGSCTNYCGANSSIPSCTLIRATPNRIYANHQIPINGITCASSCPTGQTWCTSGTVANSILNSFNGQNPSCDSNTPMTSVLTLNAGANPTGTAYSCSSNISGLTITNSSKMAVCTGASSLNACIMNLQTGTNTSSIPLCSLPGNNATAQLTNNVLVNMGCSTPCSSASGVCDPTSYSTISDFISKTKAGLCLRSSNGGAKSLPLVFKASQTNSANCSTLCSNTTSGSCDGMGWGALDGSTVSDYISKVLGGSTTCASNTRQINDTALMHVDATKTSSACTSTPNSPFYFTQGSPYLDPNATNYVTGDASHNASDFLNYIVNQSSQVLGGATKLAIGELVHMPTDTSLTQTRVSTQYINLANALNSNQVSSVTQSNYGSALAQISNYIVQTIEFDYILPVTTDQGQMVSVSYVKSGTTNWVSIPSNQWSFAGHTLSISPSLGLAAGDQIFYKFKNN